MTMGAHTSVVGYSKACPEHQKTFMTFLTQFTQVYDFCQTLFNYFYNIRMPPTSHIRINTRQNKLHTHYLLNIRIGWIYFIKIMPGCSAPNCSNSKEKGFQMYIFPSNANRAKIWKLNSRRKMWNVLPSGKQILLPWSHTKHSRLCEVIYMFIYSNNLV